MSSTTITLEEAGARLAELVELVQHGGEVVILQNEQPKAKLVAVPATSGRRVFGQYHGKLHIAEDFDSSLPDEFWTGNAS